MKGCEEPQSGCGWSKVKDIISLFACSSLNLYYRKKTEQRDILRSTENVKKLEALIVFISFLFFYSLCNCRTLRWIEMVFSTLFPPLFFSSCIETGLCAGEVATLSLCRLYSNVIFPRTEPNIGFRPTTTYQLQTFRLPLPRDDIPWQLQSMRARWPLYLFNRSSESYEHNRCRVVNQRS